MHKHLLAAVLSLAVAMTGASALEAHAKTTFVTIGTGGITGVYYPTGGAIAKIVNAKKDKYDIRPPSNPPARPYSTSTPSCGRS